MRRIGGVVLTVTGFLACPCHLIITLPLLISLLAGTAVGSFLSRNVGLVYTGAGLYFVVALVLGAWFLFGPKRQNRERDAASSTCVPVASALHTQEQSSMLDDLPALRRREEGR
jgi:mercuric ion transport protein